MAKSLCCVFLGLLWSATALVAGGTVGDPTFNLTLQPANPTSDDYVQAHIELLSAGYASVEKVERDGRSIAIHIDDNCLISCGVGSPFQFDVALGRLEPGAWSVTAYIDDSEELTLDFLVEAGPAGRAELIVQPAAPTQADLVSLQIPYQNVPCEGRRTFDGIDRSGNTFQVQLALGVPLPDCVDATRGVGSFHAELGQLAPGTYRVELWGSLAAATDPPTPPVQLDELEFTVAPKEAIDLQGGRYRASLAWRTPDGATGTAKPVAGGSDESALFSFFTPDNWEVMVKVLDGCAINGNRWVFLSAATDVEFTLTVEDLESDAAPYVHTSGPGLAPPLADTAAFACTP
jgi:hypothetical protein